MVRLKKFFGKLFKNSNKEVITKDHIQDRVSFSVTPLLYDKTIMAYPIYQRILKREDPEMKVYFYDFINNLITNIQGKKDVVTIITALEWNNELDKYFYRGEV